MRIFKIKHFIYIFSISTLLIPISATAMHRPNLVEDIAGFTSSDCTGNGATAVCVVAKNDGVLKVSTDAGKTWLIKTAPGLPTGARYFATSCTGEGTTAVCTVAGYSNEGPLLVVSSNGGHSWKVKSVDGLPNDYKFPFASVSCTGNGPHTVCAAGGWLGLLAVSKNAGASWEFKLLPEGNYPRDVASPTIQSISCTGSESSTLCVAAGGLWSLAGSFPTSIYVSTDKGNTWEAKTAVGFPTRRSGQYRSVSCTGSGANAMCVAAGETLDGNGRPAGLFLTVSTNGGNDWVNKSINGLENMQGTLSISSVSCAGSGKTAACAAGGWDSYSAEGPLAVSVDGGNTWATKYDINVPESKIGHFPSTKCTSNGAHALCVAAGIGEAASLMVSNDGGATWKGKTVNGQPTSGYLVFDSISCAGKTCVADGMSEGVSVLAVSMDGGNSWTLK